MANPVDPIDYGARYLTAKITADDRAVNPLVLADLKKHLKSYAVVSSPDALTVVDIGAGVGAMLHRLREHSVFESFRQVDYTIVDYKAENVVSARERVMRLPGAAAADPTVEQDAGAGEDFLPPVAVPGLLVRFCIADAVAFLARRPAAFGLVVGAAVIDMLQPDTDMPTILASLSASGARAVYFPITFDGTTHFFPPSSAGSVADAHVMDAFHASMGRNLMCGVDVAACDTGRHIRPLLNKLGATAASSGASSWTVCPDASGKYFADEQTFVECIIGFVENAAVTSTDDSFGDKSVSAEIVRSRREQLKNGKLYFTVHNVDTFAAF